MYSLQGVLKGLHAQYHVCAHCLPLNIVVCFLYYTSYGVPCQGFIMHYILGLKDGALCYFLQLCLAP